MMPALPFKAIAAMSLDRVIGSANTIPWYLPKDFEWFKQTTMGHVLVLSLIHILTLPTTPYV